MPRVSAWLLRASLVHLVLGFTVGALLLAEKGLTFAPSVWRLRAAHIEVLLFGWVVQLVLGVALWIFPRSRLSGSGAGGDSLPWSAFLLLNVGVAAVAGGLELGGRIAELAAVGAVAAGLWRRARPGLSQM